VISPRALAALQLDYVRSNADGDSILLADGKTRVQRLGTIELDLHFAFLDSNSSIARFTLRYTVMDIPMDIILGVEALRSLFPDDQITRYFTSPSILASLPSPLEPLFSYDPRHDDEPRPLPLSSPSPLPPSSLPDYHHHAAVFMLMEELSDLQIHNDRQVLEEASKQSEE
jgi:hypothetical protein